MSDGVLERSYYELIFHLKGVLEGCNDAVAGMASAAALLKDRLDHVFWVGFYLAQPDGTLQVGPYQGPIACIRLPNGRGVCGEAVRTQRSVLVADVRSYPGHIECDARSKSEIVVPICIEGRILGVLDVDSDKSNAFTETDRTRLEEIADLLAPLLARGGA